MLKAELYEFAGLPTLAFTDVFPQKTQSRKAWEFVSNDHASVIDRILLPNLG